VEEQNQHFSNLIAPSGGRAAAAWDQEDEDEGGDLLKRRLRRWEEKGEP
jgi:hypothetical protein